MIKKKLESGAEMHIIQTGLSVVVVLRFNRYCTV